MITEDGTGLPNADSYVTVADITSYAAARGITSWANGSPAAQTSAAIVGTDYVEAKYRALEEALTLTQSLQWPTVTGLVPACVKRATMMLAIEALAGPLGVPAERGIKSTKEALEGVGSTETVYDDAEPAQDPYPFVTALLSPVAVLRSAPTSGAWFGRIVK